MLHIVDDDDEMRKSLAFLAESRAICSKTYENGLSFLAELDGSNIYDPKGNCILIDMHMPGMSGMELFDILIRRKLIGRFPVIFLTSHVELPTAVSVLKRGAFDFYEKPFHGNVLLDSVQEGMKASRRAWGRVEIENNFSTLSARECEVLNLLLQGKSSSEIANQLGISERTIETHRAHIFRKMKVKTALELAIVLGSNIDISQLMTCLNVAYKN